MGISIAGVHVRLLAVATHSHTHTLCCDLCQLRNLFVALDTDDSGFLDFREFLVGLAILNEQVRPDAHTHTRTHTHTPPITAAVLSSAHCDTHAPACPMPINHQWHTQSEKGRVDALRLAFTMFDTGDGKMRQPQLAQVLRRVLPDLR